MQNLLNLRVNYAGRFLHLSILLISIYTLHPLRKPVKRKFQEVLHLFLEPSRPKTYFNASTYISSPADSYEVRRLRKDMLIREAEPK
jgi:hypothetical protein